MSSRNVVSAMENFGACYDSRQWASNFQTAEAAYNSCTRVDWMRWLLWSLPGIPRQNMVNVGMRATNLLRPLMQPEQHAICDGKPFNHAEAAAKVAIHNNSSTEYYVKQAAFQFRALLDKQRRTNDCAEEVLNAVLRSATHLIPGRNVSFRQLLIDIIREEVPWPVIYEALPAYVKHALDY